MPAAADVVSMGETMLRLSSPRGRRLGEAERLDVHVAGSEGNVAAALAQLGVPVRWFSRLPRSPLGRRVDREMRLAGVETVIEWAGEEERLGLFFSDTGVPPRPTTVVYDRADSAFSRVSAIPPGFCAGARVAHLTGITPALGPGPAAAAREFVAAAGDAGCLVSLDVNYRARLWSEAEARAALEPLLAAAGLVVCGRDDARRLFGLEGEPGEVAAALAAAAPAARLVVVTAGAAGCAAVDADGGVYSQPAPATTVVDRFGMGDAFMAGLIRAVLSGQEPGAALAAATELAAWKGGVRGDVVRLEPGELEAAAGAGGREIVR